MTPIKLSKPRAMKLVRLLRNQDLSQFDFEVKLWLASIVVKFDFSLDEVADLVYLIYVERALS